MQEIQAGHLLVRDLRVDADQLRMLERRDEPEVRAGRRHVDVAARLVRLGLEREAEAVLLVDRIPAQIVDRLAQPFHRFVGAAARIGLDPLAPAPEHEDLRAELGAEIHRAHRLLERVGAHARVVRREGAVPEHGVEEQADGRHRDDDAGAAAQARLELLHDAVALRGGGVDGDEIVVVQVDAPRTDLGEHRDRVDRRERRPDDVAERIAAAVADGP